MVQRGSLVGSVVLVALLGASAPWSRALPPCGDIAAAEREAARLAGRCEGRAPIVSVNPSAQRNRPVREVSLPRRPVPDLRGRPFNHRDERLARFVVAIDYRESAQRRDWVIDQTPRPPAALPEGASLRVVLSDGALVRVPDVRGNFARALTLLYRAGLSWSTGEGPTGSVVGQVPPAGSAVKPGTPIVLRLAPGPVALAPESTRPEVAPTPPTPSAPPPAAPPATQPPASTAPAVPRTAPALPPPITPPATTPSRTAPAMTTMPDLQGMIYDAARERLEGYSVQRVHRAGTEPGGTVIGQSPAAGAPLAAGATVRLVLSDGSLVRVPRVMSFTLAEARQRLGGGELRPVIVNVASDAPAGTVITQQPGEGAIAQRGSTVRIGVSSGPGASPAAAPPPGAPPMVPMPNLVGSTVERARAQLDGLKVERSERAAREPVGTVLEQNPAPGVAIERGGTVSIVVASRGRPETIEVANVVGQDAETALKALSEFRLERVAVPSTEPAGRVLEQEPAAGATLPPGSTVRLRVSDASLVRVPSFAHMTLAQARDAARASGLALTLSGGRDDAGAPVTAQQPAAGAEIARGGTLSVEVADRVLPFDVPPAVRGAWTRVVAAATQPSPRDLAIAAVVLLALLALLVLARRRARRPYAPVEPVFAPAEPRVERRPLDPPIAPIAPRSAIAVPKPAPRRPPPAREDSAQPTIVTRREARPAPVVAAPPIPEPEPVVHGATARVDADPAETVALNAAPRGPEIRLAARLDAGGADVRELPAETAPDELTEETK